jgi:hypothetical protein
MKDFPLLGRALRSIALRWLLFTLLLLAQQAALTHALGHAGGHAHESVAALHGHEHQHEHGHEAVANAGHDESGGTAVSGQCAFDLVYSQVLGGLPAGYSLHFAAAEVVVPAVTPVLSRGASARVPYDSRGPPAFS